MFPLTLHTFCKLLLLAEPHAFLPVMLPGISKIRWVDILRCSSLKYVLHWASQVVLAVKDLPTNAGHITSVGSIPGSRRSLGGGHGNSLLYSWLENPMDREAYQAILFMGLQKKKGGGGHGWSFLACKQLLHYVLLPWILFVDPTLDFELCEERRQFLLISILILFISILNSITVPEM